MKKVKLKSYAVKARHILAWLEKHSSGSCGPCDRRERMFYTLTHLHFFEDCIPPISPMHGWDLWKKGRIADWHLDIRCSGNHD